MIAWIKLHNFTGMKCYYECYKREKIVPLYISSPSPLKSDSSNNYQKITVFNFCPPGTKVGFTGLAALIVRSVEHTKSLLSLFPARTVQYTAENIQLSVYRCYFCYKRRKLEIEDLMTYNDL